MFHPECVKRRKGKWKVIPQRVQSEKCISGTKEASSETAFAGDSTTLRKEKESSQPLLPSHPWLCPSGQMMLFLVCPAFAVEGRAHGASLKVSFETEICPRKQRITEAGPRFVQRCVWPRLLPPALHVVSCHSKGLWRLCGTEDERQ
ncbi:hypothetical protein AAFF_G00040470 [Aldrovandia affinis]|uniref:Uncharacterized protein n=1 Tax=Aldrovandia affinis TaxID=143900 RepID=A0AAD7S2V9_9TELE|nr:hypothetical protein AAFF_G00040470 [Aldrovandia affinis]